MQETPFQVLQNIADRSRQLAVGLPSQQEVQTYWSGIGFTLGGQKFLAPMEQVTEILTAPGYTRLPGVKPWVIGVSNVRGRLVPIIDLGKFFNIPASTQSYRTKRILVIEHHDMLNGLVVESVEGMQHFPVETFSDEGVELPGEGISDYADGHYLRNAQPWVVFGVQELVTSQNFMQVAM